MFLRINFEITIQCECGAKQFVSEMNLQFSLRSYIFYNSFVTSSRENSSRKCIVGTLLLLEIIFVGCNFSASGDNDDGDDACYLILDVFPYTYLLKSSFTYIIFCFCKMHLKLRQHFQIVNRAPIRCFAQTFISNAIHPTRYTQHNSPYTYCIQLLLLLFHS